MVITVTAAKRIATVAATLIATVFMLLLVASIVFNAPLLLGYVKSGSMKPTIERYDLIMINPFDRDYAEGDIIVFKSGDEWVCHRIVGVMGNGFLTKGDANVATDQFSGKDVVGKGNIAGKVITVGGDVVRIPGAGKYVQQISNSFDSNKFIAFILLLSGGLLLSSDALFSESRRKGRKRRKNTIRIGYGTIAVAITVAIVVAMTFAMVASFETKRIEYGTTAAGGKRSEWVLPGSEFTRTVEVENGGRYPYYYVVKTGSRSKSNEETFLLMPGEGKTFDVRVSAPSDTALHTERIRILKYLPLLPISTVEYLSGIHEFLPVVAMNSIIASVLLTGYRAFGSRGEIKIKVKRKRWLKWTHV